MSLIVEVIGFNTDCTARAVGKLISNGQELDVVICLADLDGKVTPVVSTCCISTIGNEIITDNYSYDISKLPDSPIVLGNTYSFIQPIYIETLKS